MTDIELYVMVCVVAWVAALIVWTKENYEELRNRISQWNTKRVRGSNVSRGKK